MDTLSFQKKNHKFPINQEKKREENKNNEIMMMVMMMNFTWFEKGFFHSSPPSNTKENHILLGQFLDDQEITKTSNDELDAYIYMKARRRKE